MHFDLGRGAPGRLLLVVHHLVVDGVSWRILREDLEAAYLAARRRDGAAASAEDDVDAHLGGARRCVSQAAPTCRSRIDALARGRRSAAGVLPADALAGETPRRRARRRALSEAETRAIAAGTCRKSFRTQINDVLLDEPRARAAASPTGDAAFRIDLEGHGREHIADDVDVSRTVGWFTTLFPVALRVAGRRRCDRRACSPCAISCARFRIAA